MTTTFDAIVLTGGAGSRLGGMYKPGLVVAGVSLLQRVLEAVPDARTVVIVGPGRVSRGDNVVLTREDPPGGGPVAAIAAGLTMLDHDSSQVMLLAGDLVHFGQSSVRRLRSALDADTDAVGAVLRDETDRPQWLASAWRTAQLRAAMPTQPRDAALHRTLAELAVRWVPAQNGESFDVDTEADLRRARRSAGRSLD